MTAIRVGSARRRAARDRPGRDVERRLHGRGGDVGQRLLDLLDGRDAEQVGGGDPEQLPPAYAPGQRRRRWLGSSCRRPPPRPRRPASARAARHAARRRRRAAATASGARPSRSTAYLLLASSRASRCATAPSSRSSRRYQCVDAERVAEPPEGEQPAVGVGRVGEPAEHHRQQRALDRRPPAHPGRQRLEVAQRAGRVLRSRAPPAGRAPPRG